MSYAGQTDNLRAVAADPVDTSSRCPIAATGRSNSNSRLGNIQEPRRDEAENSVWYTT